MLDTYKLNIVSRGSKEIEYCEGRIDSIKRYTKEQAVNELIKEAKLEEKINVISSYISGLGE